jgi:hypothetical protein
VRGIELRLIEALDREVAVVCLHSEASCSQALKNPAKSVAVHGQHDEG